MQEHIGMRRLRGILLSVILNQAEAVSRYPSVLLHTLIYLELSSSEAANVIR